MARRDLTSMPGMPLLRDPAVSSNHIAFSYAGNIWVADHDGSNARLLTNGHREARPTFSPDGAEIAFARDIEGIRSVCVVPITGGEPRRLTYHPADLGMISWNGVVRDALSWMPDGKRILFNSRRAAFATGVVQLFTVPAEGGAVVQAPLARAAQATFSPDGTRIAFVPNVQWQPEWKGYRGGQTTCVCIADACGNSIEAIIPRDNSNDFNPMWVGDIVYFLSDRNGPVTLFSYDLSTKRVSQVLRNDGFDIKSASASAHEIIYEQLGSVHLLDLRSGTRRLLDIRPVRDFPELRPHFLSVADLLESRSNFDRYKIGPKISPDGAHVAFGVHGEVLTICAEHGAVQNLTRTTDAVERDPAWSPDGKSIAYFSDESGEYALHVRNLSDPGGVTRIELPPATFAYAPTWSPDCRKICFTDKSLNYWYVDIARRVPVRIDRDLFADPLHRRQLTWSADSRWICYTKQRANQLHALFLYSVEEGCSYPLTDGSSDALHPTFDKGGKYLYFTASTDIALKAGWLDMSSLRRPVTRNVYAVVLDGILSAGARTSLEGVARQIFRCPIPARNYEALFAGKPGTLFLIEGPVVEEPSKILMGAEKRMHRFRVDAQRLETILDEVTFVDVSATGEKALYARQTGSCTRQWFISPVDVADADRAIADSLQLCIERAKVWVDPCAEWRHMYAQVWRNLRDFFYDPQLHGLDLEEVRSRYEPFLDRISSRDDLDYLFGEMLGNVCVGHMLAAGPDTALLKATPANVGLLGADYIVENGRYRFARIYDGDIWNPECRAPLGGPGIDVRAGEYLLAVNGNEVQLSSDLYLHFQGTAEKEIVLTVGPQPDGGGSRNIVVVPVASDARLRAFAWTERNRRKVEELTEGRVAYVHVPDTHAGGLASFDRHFFAQLDKEAAIIDVRFNCGGLMPDYIIDCLRRTLLHCFHTRDGRDVTTPMKGIFGPKAMLINEMAGSGGDALAWMFRKAEIGPLVGKRTWGGLVGHYTRPSDLLDGGYAATPNLAFYTPDGTWEIENYGVAPDFEVENNPASEFQGRDEQLEQAVDVILRQLERKRRTSQPQCPPFPEKCASRSRRRRLRASG